MVQLYFLQNSSFIKGSFSHLYNHIMIIWITIILTHIMLFRFTQLKYIIEKCSIK